MHNEIKMRMNVANRRYFTKKKMLPSKLFPRTEVPKVYSMELLGSVRNMRILRKLFY